MRRLLPALLVVAACRVLAADAGPPPGSQPLPEPPPPPPGIVDEPDASAPQITIKHKGQDKVEEYRVNGKLYMIKVTPPDGIPYYLIDNQGNGVMTRYDPGSSGMQVPMWVIKTF